MFSDELLFIAFTIEMNDEVLNIEGPLKACLIENGLQNHSTVFESHLDHLLFGDYGQISQHLCALVPSFVK